MRMIALFLTLSLALSAAETTPEQDRESGLAALRAAQADPDQIVVAAKLLTKAADGLAKAGKDAEAQEVESYLFWCKKKMTLQQIDAFLGTGNGVAKAVVAKMEQVEKKEVKPEDSKDWLAKADAYAAKTTDQFLVAVRYFEVASRFKGTPEGETALDKSLKALQQAKVDSKAVAGKAEKGDGKIYVQSKPVGAQILVVQNGELRDTGLKTPSLVQLPVGRAELVLRLAKHDEAKLNTDVTTSISKPEVVVMEPEKFDLEVTAEAGLGDAWDVYVDGKPVLDKAGKPAVAPCTIRVAEGVRSIQLVKDGFVDTQPVRVQVKVGVENAGVVVKGRAVAGQSKTLTLGYLQFVGKWTATFTKPGASNQTFVYDFSSDGTVTVFSKGCNINATGKTKIEKNGKLSFAYKLSNGVGRIEAYTIVDGKLKVEHYASPTIQGLPEWLGDGRRDK